MSGQDSSAFPRRTLHVKYENWKQNSARVLDSDKTNVLYTSTSKLRKPHMTFRSWPANNPGQDREDEGTIVGTVTFPLFHVQVDTVVHDRPISLRPKSKWSFKPKWAYSSPAFDDATLTWQSRCGFKTFDFVLLDENQLPLAKFSSNDSWTKWKKVGDIEICDPQAASSEKLDEIVVVGLALVEYLLIQVRGATAAAAA